jgi:outer membrane protein TolC
MKNSIILRRLKSIPLGVAFLSIASSFGHSADIPLSMREIGRAAVLNNPSLSTARFTPALAGSSVSKAKAIYDPVLSALIEFKASDSKLAPDSFFTNRSRSWDSNLSLDALMQTGATASAGVSSTWSRDDTGLAATDSVSPAISVSIVQPILRNAGKAMTERGITSADYALKIAESDWYSQMLSTTAQACTQLLTVLKVRESLDSRRASVETAKRLHVENQARVKAGVLAPIDLLDSELGVATREVDLLQAEKAVHDAEDTLRFLLHASDNDAFVSRDPIADPESPFVADNAIGKAFDKRPEMVKARLSIRNEEFNISVAKNQMLPDLSLKGSAGLAGLGSDTGRGISDVAQARYPFGVVGVGLTFPIRNGSARADYQSSRLRAAQSRSGLAGLESSIVLEVNNAIRSIDTRFRQIGVARKGVQVGETRLASFIKRNALGMATTRNVLDAEADLTAAREALTLAKADYQAALVELWRATGELPEREGIEVSVKNISESAWQEIR